MIEVELLGVEVELPGTPPSVILAAVGESDRQLSIFIGPNEAQAIEFALRGVDFPRPLTHDLMVDVLNATGFELRRVVVTEIKGTTFYAELQLGGPGDAETAISARPSDAIAVAVRVGCPIVVADEVMEQAGVVVAEVDVVDPDEVVEEFRHFIDSVDPDDFAS